MMVKIPCYSDAKHAQAVQECIAKAAQESGMSDYRAAYTMSWFLEWITVLVSQGIPVRIPGFGVFSLIRVQQGTHKEHAYPSFHPAGAYRRLIAMTVTLEEAQRAASQVRRFDRNSTMGRGRSSLPSKTFGWLRKSILAQARREQISWANDRDPDEKASARKSQRNLPRAVRDRLDRPRRED